MPISDKQPNSSGKTALSWAVFENDQKIVELLLNFGAKYGQRR